VSTDEFSTHDAAYVLGALSPPERTAFEAHLRTCPSCAGGVTQLAGLPGLLAKVPVEEVIDPVPVPLPQTLLPRLLREVAARRRRRRWVTGLSAAAAAVVIATGAGVVGSSLAPDQRPATPPAAAATAPGRDLVAVVPSPVTASVAMVPMTWGTRLDLRCGYYAYGGGSASREYTLVVHDRTGRSQQVAAWQALPDKELSLTAASSWHPRDIADVEVQAPGGRALLRLAN
jgi:anti-sigma factor RsiW